MLHIHLQYEHKTIQRPDPYHLLLHILNVFTYLTHNLHDCTFDNRY